MKKALEETIEKIKEEFLRVDIYKILKEELEIVLMECEKIN